MKNLFFLIVGLALIFGSFFLFFERALEENRIQTIRINDAFIRVEIADTEVARSQGLSHRQVLKNGTGMLFVFDSPSRYGIWMKNMNFPIDIVWIDEEFRIAGIEKSVSPETFPEIFYPDNPIKYALELPAGFLDTQGIGAGAIVHFED